MPVPTLVQLCHAQIRKNIDQVMYVSTLPYWKVRNPILKHVKLASQLAIIEEYSPQIIGEDEELWEAFCKRDFYVPMKRDPHHPDPNDAQPWRQVYEYYAEEERKKEALALEQLGASFNSLDKEKMKNQTSIGDPRKLPRVAGGLAFGRSRGKGPGPGATLTFGGGARTSNAVKKAKREALEVAARKRLSVPKTMRQTAQLSKVTQAPESMKAEARIRAQPKFVPAGASNAVKRQREEGDERSQMEARLLAAKKQKIEPRPTSNKEDRLGSSKSAEGSKLGASSEPAQSTPPRKPRTLFARPQSTPPSRVVAKTVGIVSTNPALEKTGAAPKTKAGQPGSSAAGGSCISIGRSAAPSSARSSAISSYLSTDIPTGNDAPSSPPRSSRPEPSRFNAVARQDSDLSRVSRVLTPGFEDYKLSKIVPPKRRSRSPSVGSSIFGSPEPEAAGPSGRRSSVQSNSSTSPPPSAKPTRRANTPPMAAAPHKPKSTSAPKRNLDEAPPAAEGQASAHPPAKKKKVDIFMRRPKR
jgi:hypothetical protein